MSGSSSSVGAAEAPEPLKLAVHSLPALDAARRTRLGRLKLLLVLLVCATPVIASYFTYYVIRPQGRTNHGELIRPTRPLPATLALRDLDGGRVPPAALQRQWLLLVVAGGACDGRCETQLYLQRQLREMLGRDRERLDKLWLVPDEAVLRPELLRSVAGTQVLRVRRGELGAWLQPAAGRELEDHLYLVDPMGEWMMRFPAPSDPARIKRDLVRLMNASRGWDTAGR